jgi:pimeloyl-ACP methyl ester carboxylesterase
MSVPVRRQYIDGRYGQMHLRVAMPEHARHRPLLCFHASPMSGMGYARFMAEMGRDRVVIAPDTPGFGGSDAPPEPPEIADYAAAMGDVLDHFGFHEADLMGYHTGSKIGMELTLQRPQQIGRLVLVSAPIFTAEELVEFRAHYNHPRADESGEILLKHWKSFRFWYRGHDFGLSAQQFAESLRGGLDAWWGHRAAFNYPSAAKLAEITHPVLILNPEDDLHTQTSRAQNLLHNGRIQECPGWTHGFLDMHTEAAARIVRGFLDKM